MSMAENLRAWSDYLDGVETLHLEEPSLDLLRLVIEDAIITIESMERPERLAKIATKVRRELGAAYCSAVSDAARQGAVVDLSRYRVARAAGVGGDAI